MTIELTKPVEAATLTEDEQQQFDNMLQQRLDETAQALTDQTQRADRLTRELVEAREEHERFKKQVVRAARKGKVENGWCEVINEIVDDLGLEWGDRVYRADVTVKFTVRAKVADHVSDGNDIDDDWVFSSISIEENEGELHIRIDEDNENIEFIDVYHSVDSTREVPNEED